MHTASVRIRDIKTSRGWTTILARPVRYLLNTAGTPRRLISPDRSRAFFIGSIAVLHVRQIMCSGVEIVPR
jgi:hypothetical protein